MRLGRLTWPPTTLRRRLALWVGLSTAASLLVFAGVAFYVVLQQDTQDDVGEPPDSYAESFDEVRREVLTAMAFAAPLGLALAVGGAYWLARRTLEPVDAVIAAARDITPAGLSRRLAVPPVADELQQLVVALNESFARLEDGFAALSRFAGHASHELRTPIAALRNELEVGLRRPRSSQEWEAIARSSLHEVKRLTELTDSLLRYTRAEVTSPGPRGPTEIGELIADAVADCRTAAGGTQIVLEADPAFPPGEIWVEGDRDGLQSVLANVLRNAAAFAGPRGRVAVSALVDAPSTVTIHIDDDGPGIAVDDRELVFEPFTRGRVLRADHVVPLPSPGVGLGLSIARRIVESCGGRISAAQAPLGGARITIDLNMSSRR